MELDPTYQGRERTEWQRKNPSIWTGVRQCWGSQKNDLPCPRKDIDPNCSQIGRRVTSATCADGHATAIGAVSPRRRNRHKTIPRRCSPSSPSRSPTDPRKANNPSLKLNRQRSQRRKSRSLPLKLLRAKASGNRFGEIAAGVADVVDAAVGSRRRLNRLPCPGRVGQPERPLKPKYRPKPPARLRPKLP